MDPPEATISLQAKQKQDHEASKFEIGGQQHKQPRQRPAPIVTRPQETKTSNFQDQPGYAESMSAPVEKMNSQSLSRRSSGMSKIIGTSEIRARPQEIASAGAVRPQLRIVEMDAPLTVYEPRTMWRTRGRRVPGLSSRHSIHYRAHSISSGTIRTGTNRGYTFSADETGGMRNILMNEQIQEEPASSFVSILEVAPCDEGQENSAAGRPGGRAGSHAE